MKSEKRRTFVAREDLLAQMNDLAKKSGRSMYDVINETFEIALQANEEGVNLRKALDEQGIVKDAHEKGFIMNLENLWLEMVEMAYSSSKGESLKAWAEAGQWFAKRYLSQKRDPVDAFGKDMKRYFWDIPDLEFVAKKNEIAVRALSPKFSESHAALFAAFIEGALQAMNFSIHSREVSNGSVRIIGLRKQIL
jgi:hypothetical protein